MLMKIMFIVGGLLLISVSPFTNTKLALLNIYIKHINIILNLACPLEVNTIDQLKRAWPIVLFSNLIHDWGCGSFHLLSH